MARSGVAPTDTSSWEIQGAAWPFHGPAAPWSIANDACDQSTASGIPYRTAGRPSAPRRYVPRRSFGTRPIVRINGRTAHCLNAIAIPIINPPRDQRFRQASTSANMMNA